MLIENFNKTIDTWIAALEQYNIEKLRTKPGADSWSIGQVYMHLIEETNYYMTQMEACLQSDENAAEEMTEKAKVMFSSNDFPDEIIKGDPLIAHNVPQPASKLQLEEKMQLLKDAMNRIGNRIISSPNIGKAKHPGLASFNAREWCQYADMHLRHHLRQKRRIDDFLSSL